MIIYHPRKCYKYQLTNKKKKLKEGYKIHFNSSESEMAHLSAEIEWNHNIFAIEQRKVIWYGVSGMGEREASQKRVDTKSQTAFWFILSILQKLLCVCARG